MKKKILLVIYLIIIVITILHIPQRYVAEYNKGNDFYQKGEYENAIMQYKKALSRAVPKKKECKIRINSALAICKTVQIDLNDEASIKSAINTYESAIEILVENGCANRDDNNGHSQEAERLKNQIQKEIDRLKKLQNSEDGDSGNEEPEENETGENETIEEKIQNIKKDANKEQRQVEQQFRNYNKGYKKVEKNW